MFLVMNNRQSINSHQMKWNEWRVRNFWYSKELKIWKLWNIFIDDDDDDDKKKIMEKDIHDEYKVMNAHGKKKYKKKEKKGQMYSKVFFRSLSLSLVSLLIMTEKQNNDRNKLKHFLVFFSSFVHHVCSISKCVFGSIFFIIFPPMNMILRKCVCVCVCARHVFDNLIFFQNIKRWWCNWQKKHHITFKSDFQIEYQTHTHTQRHLLKNIIHIERLLWTRAWKINE